MVYLFLSRKIYPGYGPVAGLDKYSYRIHGAQIKKTKIKKQGKNVVARRSWSAGRGGVPRARPLTAPLDPTLWAVGSSRPLWGGGSSQLPWRGASAGRSPRARPLTSPLARPGRAGAGSGGKGPPLGAGRPRRRVPRRGAGIRQVSRAGPGEVPPRGLVSDSQGGSAAPTPGLCRRVVAW